jgi:signal transduction histidine kinase
LALRGRNAAFSLAARLNTLSPIPLPKDLRRIWAGLYTAVLVGLAAAPWIVSFGPVTGEPLGLLAAAVVTAVPGILMLRASRRLAISGRLRQSLLLFGLAMILTAGGNLIRLAGALGAPLPSIPGVAQSTNLAIWALGLVGLVRLPLMPLVPGSRWRIATDVAIAGIGMALILFVVWALPGLRSAPGAERRAIMLFNLMEAGNLVVLNMILVRRPLRETRRAVWWISASAIIETVYLVAFQYGIGRAAPDDRLANCLFFVDYLAYFYAAQAFLADTKPGLDAPARPVRFWSLNLLPVAAVLGVGGLLILSAIHDSRPAVIVLATGIVVMTLLLLGRVMISTLESLQTVSRKAAEQRREQAERMELVGRLSGNIAQVVQTLVAGVRRHAEQLRGASWQNPQMSAGIQAIGESTLRASVLAERLLLASGQARSKQAPRRLGDIVRQQQEAMNRLVGDRHIMIWDVAKNAGNALVAPSDLETIIRELVANAGEATYIGGRITIRVQEETLAPGSVRITPRPQPGLYSVLEVADNGRGFAEEDLPHVMEPFFKSKGPEQGRGLGLSVVHGIAARYGGGLQIETEPGMGSRVRVYLHSEAARAA